jgi:di/tricarboxylate transporter
MSPASVPVAAPVAKSKHSATISSWSEAIGLLSVLIVGSIIWFIPPPAGVQPKAWHLLAIFVATIVGIIIKPLPMGAFVKAASSAALHFVRISSSHWINAPFSRRTETPG